MTVPLELTVPSSWNHSVILGQRGCQISPTLKSCLGITLQGPLSLSISALAELREALKGAEPYLKQLSRSGQEVVDSLFQKKNQGYSCPQTSNSFTRPQENS